MGYFSEKAIRQEEFNNREEDCSWMMPVQRLFQRLDELDERLKELEVSGALYSSGRRLSVCDLRYCLPDQFTNVFEATAAKELSEKDLTDKYGIRISEAEQETGQITIAGFFAFPVLALSPYEVAA